MSHLLEITDNNNVQLFDMLGTVLGIDLASRQISPIGNGRYEERYRIFGGDSNTATAITNMTFTLGKVVNNITNYGNAPSLSTPIWLHEKSEGEASEIRRAPLFRATFQPTAEGSVGQLQLMNGFVGLLMLERGDWEKITNSNLTLAITDGSLIFGDIPITSNGSVNGRIKRVLYNIWNTHINYFSMGIRAENFGIANFQPCVSFGSGISEGTSGSGWSLTTGGSKPSGQTQTYTQCLYTPAIATHTHKILLSEVSTNSLDSTNQDYVGSYRLVLRTKQSLMTDAYFKLTASYGYEDNMIENAPVYIQGEVNYRGLELGTIDIPNFSYQPSEGGTEDLSSFTFAMKVELVGAPAGGSDFYADSIFLIPTNSLTLSNFTGDPAGSSTYLEMNMWFLNHPDGSYALRTENGKASSNVSFNMSVPMNGGTVVYYSENEPLDLASGVTLSMQWYDRYNSLAGS